MANLYRGPRAAKQAFTNRETHPLLLDLILTKEFGKEYLGWEPETCWVEIGRTWNTSLSEINRNKIQAVRTCHVSDQPYERWEVFEKTGMALMGLAPRFDLIQKSTPHRASVSLEIMSHIRDEPGHSKEVYKYVAACLQEAGIIYGPGILEPCNEYLVRKSGRQLQERVRDKVASGKTPRFDGTDSDDIQVMKSLSVKDFNMKISKMLLDQLKHIFP